LAKVIAVATSTQISLEEYLHTSYEPDAEYVDGEIEERNVGEWDHNKVQGFVWLWFVENSKKWRIRSAIEQRTLLHPRRVRIPDVSVFRRDLPIEQVFTYPQLIAIEVLSPEDRQSRVQQRIQDFIDFGVENIWVIDPKNRTGWDCSDGNWTRKERFEVAGSPIYLSLDELFLKIDEDEAD
jgi:Uma2 family endonuclease